MVKSRDNKPPSTNYTHKQNTARFKYETGGTYFSLVRRMCMRTMERENVHVQMQAVDVVTQMRR